MIISVVVWILAFLTIGVCTLVGLKRGLFRSGMRIASFIIAFVIALILTNIISGGVGYFINNSIQIEQIEELVTASPTLENLILFICVKAAAPILFIIIFTVLNLLLLIPHCIVSHCMKLKDKEIEVLGVTKKRIFGSLAGFIGGFMLFAVLAFPLVGYVDIVDIAAQEALVSMTDMANSGTDSDGGSLTQAVDVLDQVTEYTGAATSDPILCAVRTMGGGALFDNLTSGEVNGSHMTLRKEVSNVGKIVSEIAPVASTEPKDWDDEQIEALNGIVEVIPDSEILTAVASEIVSYAGNRWKDGDSFMNIEAISFLDEEGNPTKGEHFIEYVYELLATTDKTTLYGDLKTLVNTMSYVVDYGAIGVFYNDYSDIDVFTSEGFVSGVFEELCSNKRFRTMIPDAVNVGVEFISDEIGVPESSVNENEVTVDELYIEVDDTLLKIETMDIESEAQVIEDIICEFTEIIKYIEQVKGISDVPELISITGRTCDIMSKSVIYGDKTDKFIKALIASEQISGMLKLSPGQISTLADVVMNAKTNKDESYQATFNSIGSMIGYIDTIIDESSTKEEKKDAIVLAITQITEAGQEAVNILVTPDTIVSLGVPEKNVDSVVTVVTNVVNEFAGLTEADAEKITAEGEAINFLVGIALNAADEEAETASSLFGTEGKLQAEAYDIVDIMVSSDVAIGTVDYIVNESTDSEKTDFSNSVSEEDLTTLSGALDSYYNDKSAEISNEQEMTELGKKLDLLGSLFGLDTSYETN